MIDGHFYTILFSTYKKIRIFRNILMLMMMGFEVRIHNKKLYIKNILRQQTVNIFIIKIDWFFSILYEHIFFCHLSSLPILHHISFDIVLYLDSSSTFKVNFSYFYKKKKSSRLWKWRVDEIFLYSIGTHLAPRKEDFYL